MEVDLVDMEAYALAKVCKLEGLNLNVLNIFQIMLMSNATSDWIENCKKGAKLFQIR